MTLRAGSPPGGAGNFSTLAVSGTNTGTVGAVTINQQTGRVNIAAAANSVVVTNSLVTTASRIFVNINGVVDTTATSVQAQSANGSFTIRTNAPATAQLAVDFLVVN